MSLLKLNIILILCAIAIFLLGYNQGWWSQPGAITYTVSSGNWTQSTEVWQLGDEITPYPNLKRDCDDVTLFTYLYIENSSTVNVTYEPKIMYGDDPYFGNKHVWVEVSDNETSWIYDWGLAIPDIDPLYEKFKGKEISYQRLLYYTRLDK